MAMKELLAALDGGRVLEVFGAGTACVVCPVGSLLYRGQVGHMTSCKAAETLLTSFSLRCVRRSASCPSSRRRRDLNGRVNKFYSVIFTDTER